MKENVNTLRLRQNGLHFADYVFKRIILNENVWILIKISLKFVLKGQNNNIASLVQIMAWRRLGDKPLSEPIMARLHMHISITRPQWVNHIPLTNKGYMNNVFVYSCAILSVTLDCITRFWRYKVLYIINCIFMGLSVGGPYSWLQPVPDILGMAQIVVLSAATNECINSVLLCYVFCSVPLHPHLLPLQELLLLMSKLLVLSMWGTEGTCLGKYTGLPFYDLCPSSWLCYW